MIQPSQEEIEFYKLIDACNNVICCVIFGELTYNIDFDMIILITCRIFEA